MFQLKKSFLAFLLKLVSKEIKTAPLQASTVVSGGVVVNVPAFKPVRLNSNAADHFNNFN